MIARKLKLPPPGVATFFLWGPRQTGKSTLLRAVYPEAVWIDLLKADVCRRYLNHPEYLRQELPRTGMMPFVVIDAVQKLPLLLDEIHWLHENRNVRFALCGSRVRKAKRGNANLLGGRAVRYEMFGLTSAELGADFDLMRSLNCGYLPRIYLSRRPQRLRHLQPEHPDLFPDSGRHPVRPMAAQFSQTAQKTGGCIPQILLFGCGCR